jgi:hypothetical protein
LCVFGVAGAQAAPAAYPDAVVLVSGYSSGSSFTTPDPACEGHEGVTWSNPDGPAAALRAVGYDVFTAPVEPGSDPLAPCAPGGAPVPPASDSIDSFGDNDANGAALAGFLSFLRDDYGVERVQLIAHSDGGNWSRAALTQDDAFTGLDVRSLTTLGTPYTGSMIADLGTELRNGRCDFTNRSDQELCESLLDIIRLIYAQIGPTAVEQLTHTYLERWNREQSIGSCPVTTIAGTGVDIDAIPFSYYNPSDGLVGEASALARSAYELPTFETIPAPDIPNLQFGGTFPVVHTEALSFLSPANLLNTPAISSKVTDIVAATAAGGPLCNAPATARSPAAGVEDRDTVPFQLTRSVGAGGRLGLTKPDDVAVTGRGVELRCDGQEVPQLPLLNQRRIRLALPGTCEGPLRVAGGSARGGAAGGALLFRSHPTNELAIVRDGRKLRVRVRGPKVRGLRLKLRRDGDVRRLQVHKGKVKLPAGDGSATLIAVAKARPGDHRVAATLVLSL